MIRSTWRTTLLVFTVLALCQDAFAQAGSDTTIFKYPVIPAQADSLSDLIPPGWHVLQQVTGDLDGDGRSDVALILEFVDSVRHERLGGWSNTQPRILVVALGLTDDGLRLLTQSNSFILRADERGGIQGPHLELAFRKDTLQVGFQFVRGHSQYSFQLIEDQLVCVLEIDVNVHSGIFASHRIDLVKDRIHIKRGPIDSDEDDIDELRPLPSHPPFTIQSLREPFATEILPGVFL